MAPLHARTEPAPAGRKTLRRWLPAVLAAGLGGSAAAQPPAPPADPPAAVKAQPPADPAKHDAPKADPAKPEKLYEIKFDKTPWKDVFEFLERESGLMYLSKDVPTGTWTVRPTKKYTLGEMIDLVNERLELDNYVILRKAQSFAIHPASEPIKKEWVQTVTDDELEKRGRTEVVQIILSLGALNAEDVLPQVKKSLSPFGTVATFSTDKLILLDKADSIRLVLRVIKEINKDKNDTLNHVCKFKRASEVAAALRSLLKEDAAPAQPQNQWGGGQWQNGQWVPAAQQPAAAAAAAAAKRFAAITITVDDQENALTITGPVGKVMVAKELLKDLDKGEVPRPAPGKARWEEYTVPAGTAEPLAKQLMARPEYAGSSVVAMAQGTDRVSVYAYQADHLFMKEYFSPRTGKSTTETKAVGVNLDAEGLATVAAACGEEHRRRHHRRPDARRPAGAGAPRHRRPDHPGRAVHQERGAGQRRRPRRRVGQGADHHHRQGERRRAGRGGGRDAPQDGQEGGGARPERPAQAEEAGRAHAPAGVPRQNLRPRLAAPRQNQGADRRPGAEGGRDHHREREQAGHHRRRPGRRAAGLRAAQPLPHRRQGHRAVRGAAAEERGGGRGGQSHHRNLQRPHPAATAAAGRRRRRWVQPEPACALGGWAAAAAPPPTRRPGGCGWWPRRAATRSSS